MNIFTLAISGASCSGKTHFKEEVYNSLLDIIKTKKNFNGKCSIEILSTDWFYTSLHGEDLEKAEKDEFDFDNPNAIDGDAFINTLRLYLDKNATLIKVPVYNFATRKTDSYKDIILNPSDTLRIIIVEGIFALCFPKINELYDFKIFIETDADTRMSRRIRRDLEKKFSENLENSEKGTDSNRGRSLESILNQYERFVKPGYINHIEPVQKYADLVVPYNHTNEKVVKMTAMYCLQSVFL